MKVLCVLFFVISFTENPSIILNFKKTKKKYMEFKSGTKMRENYFSKLQRQNLILILRCRRGERKKDNWYIKILILLLLLASILMDVQWLGNRNMCLSLGQTQ